MHPVVHHTSVGLSSIFPVQQYSPQLVHLVVLAGLGSDY